MYDRIFKNDQNFINLQDRSRELTIRDLRNLGTPQKNLGLDMSAG